ncbi:MAG: dipeptide ABC transporter ATP-binding protein [Streptosporangiales bacterium]|nr:dipeptide ABC transporter ATP-binding protein [Streptosporangiales bacterium]
MVLDVAGLRVVGLPSKAEIVTEVDLTLGRGEVLGLVGESGSGKTTLGLALLAHAKRGTSIASGSVTVCGRDLLTLPAEEVRRARGRTVAYIPQSPASALNPALRIGTQLRECLNGSASREAHREEEGEERVQEVLREVALPDTPDFIRRYPHQLSGGQQQRIAIAMAFIGRPELIVLDEPTTGLDVTTQRHVLETVRRMCEGYGASGVYISHDMAVVAGIADRLAVMYSGRVVEAGTAEAVLAAPRHPYTARLLLAVPDLAAEREMTGIPGHAPSPLARPGGCAFAPRCELAEDRCRAEQPAPVEVTVGHTVRCVKPGSPPAPRPATPLRAGDGGGAPVLEVRGLSARYGRTEVLSGIELTVPAGECVALLGESGSGKTTLSRAIVGLHPEFDGEILLDGEALAHGSYRRTEEQRRRVQYVFQNPYEALNPRKTVRELVLGPVRVLRGRVADPDAVVRDALERASLRGDLAGRYPDQLSGGERQRVAIARALATGPDLLICDEITSSLDVSVQSSIVELLRELQRRDGLSLLFVTHDIALVRNLAQHVAVLEDGRIVESGPVERVFTTPDHPYTRSLIDDTPHFTPAFARLDSRD